MKMKTISLILALMIFGAVFVSCESKFDPSKDIKEVKTVDSDDCITENNDGDTTEAPESTDGEDTTDNPDKPDSSNGDFGKTIEFDGLELTFDKAYSFETLKNQFSDKDGAEVVKLGVFIKNISDEKNKLNMFDYSLFGSKGTELESVSTYFDDDTDFAGELKPGASYYKSFYFLYDGDGIYSIDFDDWHDEITVEFPITADGASDSSDIKPSTDSTAADDAGKKSEAGSNGLGKTIEFDGLEITFDKEYYFVVLDNQFSDYNGADVVKLGAEFKNISEEKNNLNTFDFDIFGSKGTEVKNVSHYFDENIDSAGDLKPGASYHKFFYFIYDGDGDYSIDFDNWTENVSVEFAVTK